jgi:hypothetical protein
MLQLHDLLPGVNMDRRSPAGPRSRLGCRGNGFGGRRSNFCQSGRRQTVEQLFECDLMHCRSLLLDGGFLLLLFLLNLPMSLRFKLSFFGCRLVELQVENFQEMGFEVIANPYCVEREPTTSLMCLCFCLR